MRAGRITFFANALKWISSTLYISFYSNLSVIPPDHWFFPQPAEFDRQQSLLHPESSRVPPSNGWQFRCDPSIVPLQVSILWRRWRRFRQRLNHNKPIRSEYLGEYLVARVFLLSHGPASRAHRAHPVEPPWDPHPALWPQYLVDVCRLGSVRDTHHKWLCQQLFPALLPRRSCPSGVMQAPLIVARPHA